MNANRLIRMAIQLLMRHGSKRLSKGQKVDPSTKRAKQAMKIGRRIGRL